MTALRFAVVGWVVPLTALVVLLTARALYAAWTPPDELPEGCWQVLDEDPQAPPAFVQPGCERAPEPLWHRAAYEVISRDRDFLLIGVGVLLGVMLNVFAIARGRPLRLTDANARLGYRLGVVALVLLLGLPFLFGLFVTIALASFPIRG
ncbi:MAG: hypothetical protein SFW67_12530 [Myxococcaceae bacterium]|nr:hypothetical protein [Myxococcaceae bacterium]